MDISDICITKRLQVGADEMIFPADSFDVLCRSGSPRHLDMEKTMRELVRVLRLRARPSSWGRGETIQC